MGKALNVDASTVQRTLRRVGIKIPPRPVLKAVDDRIRRVYFRGIGIDRLNSQRLVNGAQMLALEHLRICDLTGQLAGAGATKILAALGAQVIRVENPANAGGWDIVRGKPPYVDDRRGVDLGGAFNNYNVGKLGITLNLKTERGKDIFRELVRVSDVVTENFSATVMARLGLGYSELRGMREDIIYVSNCGFGRSGPYVDFKTWGPLVQAVSGLTATSGMPEMEPAGWGFSFMDHMAAYIMTVAILSAVIHREATGEGQEVEIASTEAAMTLLSPFLLDWSVNRRGSQRLTTGGGNHASFAEMAPHNIYPVIGDDCWIAITCRDNSDWAKFSTEIGQAWATDRRFGDLQGRILAEDELDTQISQWTGVQNGEECVSRLLKVGVPVSLVKRPQARIEGDPVAREWGLWPEVDHPLMGTVAVDGQPFHLSRTDWKYERAAPLLGEHNVSILCGLLGLDERELPKLLEDGVIGGYG